MHSQIINIGLLSLASLAAAVPMPADANPSAPSCAGQWVWPSGSYRYNRNRHAKPSCSASGSPAATQVALGTATSTVVAAVTTTAILPSDDGVQSTVFASSAATTAAASPVEAQENHFTPATPTQATAAATSSTVSSSAGKLSGGKRGVAFNTASLVSPFLGNAPIGWSYNWASSASGLPSGIEYVPMLWGDKPDKTGHWESDAKAAIAAGATALLGFNEPDHDKQANIDVGTAATSYKTWISDKFGKQGILLGSPAVTNGPAPMGLDYLTRFMKQCADCQVDFVNVHWYDNANNLVALQKHVKDAHDLTGLPVWLTEFGAAGTNDEINSFMKEAVAWLDAQPYVQRYAYFMAGEGTLISGGKLSTYGQTFASYTK